MVHQSVIANYKAFITKIVFIVLYSALCVGLIHSTYSYGMVQLHHYASSSAEQLPAAVLLMEHPAGHDELDQQVLVQASDSEAFGRKFEIVPNEIQLSTLIFAKNHLQKQLKTDSRSLLTMRRIAHIIDQSPESYRESEEFKTLRELNKSNITKLAYFLSNSRSNKSVLMKLLRSFPQNFAHEVAHHAYPLVYGPDRVNALTAIPNRRPFLSAEPQIFEDPIDGSLKVIAPTINNSIKIWDATTGQNLVECHGHTNVIHIIQAINDPADNNRLKIISKDWNNIIKVWNISGECLASTTHQSTISSLQVVNGQAPNSLKIISGHEDGTINIWNVKEQRVDSYQIYANPTHNLQIRNLNVVLDPADPNNLFVISTINTYNRNMNISHIMTQAHRYKSRMCQGHTGLITSIQTIKDPTDNQLKIVSKSINTIKIWNLLTRQLLASCKVDYRANTERLFVIEDPTDNQLKIFSSYYDGTIRPWTTINVWNMMGQLLAKLNLPCDMESSGANVCINPTTNLLNFILADRNVVKIFDHRGTCIAKLQSKRSSSIHKITTLPSSSGQIKVFAEHRDDTISIFIGTPSHHNARVKNMVARGARKRVIQATFKTKILTKLNITKK